MKYIVYSYDGSLYAVPESEKEEIAAAEECVQQYAGRFCRAGEFTTYTEPNVIPGRKWYGYQLHSEETSFLKLVKKSARNADFL